MSRRKRAKPFDPAQAERIRAEREASKEMASTLRSQPSTAINVDADVRETMLALPKNQRERLHYLSPGPLRWKLRSKTYSGIATAMAEQWGNITLPIPSQQIQLFGDDQ